MDDRVETTRMGSKDPKGRDPTGWVTRLNYATGWASTDREETPKEIWRPEKGLKLAIKAKQPETTGELTKAEGKT